MITTQQAIDYLRVPTCEGLSTREKQEAIVMAVEALEKQIPLPVTITTSAKRCGNCGWKLSGISYLHPERKYCARCGFAIDWGENNDTD